MIVREVMTSDVATLTPAASLRSAMELMDQRRIRHVPVVEAGKLVGILSDRDLLEATGWFASEEEDGRRSARDLMHAPVKTASPGDRLVSTSLELVLHGVGCLPVVDGGRLVGIVTETDLLATFVRAVQGGSLPPQDNPELSTRMTRRPTTLAPHDTVQDARDRLRSIRARHLPVVEAGGGRLVGLVSDRDLRWAAGRAVDPRTPVEDLMSDFVVSIEPRLPLSMAASRMLEHKIGALPVVDEGRLVGILTSTDLLEHCLEVLWRD